MKPFQKLCNNPSCRDGWIKAYQIIGSKGEAISTHYGEPIQAEYDRNPKRYHKILIICGICRPSYQKVAK